MKKLLIISVLLMAASLSFGAALDYKVDNQGNVSCNNLQSVGTTTINNLVVTGTSTGQPGDLVFESTVTGSAVTSISTGSILDGRTHGGYDFEIFIYKPVALNGVATNYRMQFNGDTTDANYYRMGINTIGGAAPGAFAGSNSIIGFSTAANNDMSNVFSGAILIAPNGYQECRWSEDRILDTAFYTYVMKKTSAPLWLSTVTLVSDQAGGIGPNSRVRLWRRK